ncbi:hypothetical protein GBAR_LOCUS3584, partial [Geodia barretti]
MKWLRCASMQLVPLLRVPAPNLSMSLSPLVIKLQ